MNFEFKKGMKVKEVIKCCSGKYNYGFYDGLAKAKDDQDKYVFINKKGEVAIDCSQYADIGEFSEGLANVKNESGKYAFIDINGKIVLDFNYDKPKDIYSSISLKFSSGRAFVSINDKLSYINKEGEIVITDFTKTYGFNEGLAKIEIQGQHYYIDIDGNKVIDCSKWDDTGYFSCGLALVAKGEKYGFIDKTGEEIIPLIYDRSNGFDLTEEFIDGVAKVRKNDKYGFIDTKGNVLYECKYKKTGAFNCAGVELDGIKYFIDRKNKKLVECDIKYVGNFYEGLSRVDTGSGWGYIDSEANVVVPCNYRKVFNFSEGMGLVLSNEGTGYVSYL